MHVVQRVSKRQVGYGKRMYSPAQRGLVRNSINSRQEQDGLEGMFNIGKMFTRMFTFTPSSFKLKNIAGAIGSLTTTIATGGIANIASEIAGSSGLKLTNTTITSAHSKPMQYVGYGTMAAAAAAGLYFGGSAALTAVKGVGTTAATGTALSQSAGSSTIATALGTGGGTGVLSTVGNVFSTIGSGLMTGIQAIGSVLPVLGGVMGGGGGGQQQMVEQGVDPYAQQYQDQYAAQQSALAQQALQAQYDAQMAAQQNALYMPVEYGPQPASMNTSYGDLRSPYTAITEDGEQVQVDPMTGQVMQPGMSTEIMIGIAALALVGGVWYFSGSEKTN